MDEDCQVRHKFLCVTPGKTTIRKQSHKFTYKATDVSGRLVFHFLSSA